MAALVIAGFPGVGKTHLSQSLGPQVKVLDLDSAPFSKSAEWPQNYVQLIKSELRKNDIIFVSTHEETRTGLRESGISFTLVYPRRQLREEYIGRYRSRGSPEALCNFINKNWDSLISSCTAENRCPKIMLEKGEFISDVAESLGCNKISPSRANFTKWIRRVLCMRNR